MNKEQLIAEYDEMKKKALTEYLVAIDIEMKKYRRTKKDMKEWYANRKAEL